MTSTGLIFQACDNPGSSNLERSSTSTSSTACLFDIRIKTAFTKILLTVVPEAFFFFFALQHHHLLHRSSAQQKHRLPVQPQSDVSTVLVLILLLAVTHGLDDATNTQPHAVLARVHQLRVSLFPPTSHAPLRSWSTACGVGSQGSSRSG